MRKLLFSAGAMLAMATAHAQTFNYYYGNLHSHSSYSDGNQDSATSQLTKPFQNYRFARASTNLDFLGISEHNHFQAGMKLPYYAKGHQEADSTNEDGAFVTLYGMEWGVIANGGHALIYGINKLVGWESGNYDIYVAKNDYTSLWRLINNTPGAFAMLAHPDPSDYNNLNSAGATFLPAADSAIVGLPMRSGKANSTNITYTDPSTGSYESYFRNMLVKGYHVGIGLDHDNHNTTFGRATPGRLVVLAPSLSRANIMEAIRQRRFFGSDDWNSKIDFRLNGSPMGSIMNGTNEATIVVNYSDGDGEIATSLQLMKGTMGSGAQPVSVANVSNNGTLSYTDQAASINAYYYVVVNQTDGDKIISSPIWYNRNINGTANKDKASNFNLNVFPNPGSGPVQVSFYLSEPGQVKLSVYSVNGTKSAFEYSDTQLSDGPQNITISNLEQGIFIMELSVNGKTERRKLVVSGK